MRNMSFSMTTEAAYNRTKDVTRRFGWWFLKPGDLVQQVEKAMGLQKGETIKKIHVIRIVSTKKERVGDIRNYGFDELRREGFPDFSHGDFIRLLCEKQNKTIDDFVNRIEFEYVDFDFDGREVSEDSHL